MPIQFKIQHKNGETEERLLDKEVITIGRHPTKDVVLKTEDVSREHAIIIFRNGAAYLSCPGKFGALLNDRKLTPGEEPPIEEGARIEICSNILIVEKCSAPRSPVEQTLQADEVPGFGPAMPFGSGRGRPSAPAEATLAPGAQPNKKASLSTHSTALLDEASILARDLDALYRKNVTEEPEVRKKILNEELKNRLAKFDANGRHEMLDLLEERFSTKDEIWKRSIRQDNELIKEKATKDALGEVAAQLIENARPFQSEENFFVFCENLRQTMAMLLQFFRDLDAKRPSNAESERTQVQPGAAKILSLRATKSTPELGRLLLDWGNQEESRQARARLENTLREFLVHEQAVRSSYAESLRHLSSRLFQSLNPAVLEKQVGSEKFKFKFFKIPQKFLGPLLGWRCWLRYKKEFQEQQLQEQALLQDWLENKFHHVYQGQMERLLAELGAGEKPGNSHG